MAIRINCENCKYAQENRETGPHEYECRRYPPAFVTIYDSGPTHTKTAWPQVNKNDWCGEFTSTDSIETRESRGVAAQAPPLQRNSLAPDHPDMRGGQDDLPGNDYIRRALDR